MNRADTPIRKVCGLFQAPMRGRVGIVNIRRVAGGFALLGRLHNLSMGALGGLIAATIFTVGMRAAVAPPLLYMTDEQMKSLTLV